MDRRNDITRIVRDLFPASELVAITSLTADCAAGASTEKAIGYGEPARVELRDPTGAMSTLVFHTESPGPFGHDRRSDRARDLLLAFDTFATLPGHVRALDVGLLGRDGGHVSLRDASEPYLLTTWAEGSLYATMLRQVARRGCATEADLTVVTAIADYLAALHAEKPVVAGAYRRSIRDLVGSGEGIYGIVDSYPNGVPAAPLARLEALEARAARWRVRLREREGRLARIHGDFHPFNVVITASGEVATLDASRGCLGDPADDVTCLAINFVFFALEEERAWPDGLGVLWKTFLQRYLAQTRDEGLLATAPPFFAWRALVIANPLFYPAMTMHARDALLTLAERTLDEGRLSPWEADDLFR